MKRSARTIFGAMAFAVAFSVVGEERRASTNPNASNTVLSPARTILGGSIAAALLMAIDMTGEVGNQFATGLALVTAASTVIFFGSDVFGLILKLEGAPAPQSAYTQPTGKPGVINSQGGTGTTIYGPSVPIGG